MSFIQLNTPVQDHALPIEIPFDHPQAAHLEVPANADLGPSIRLLTDGDLKTLFPESTGLSEQKALEYGRRVESLVLSRQRDLAKVRGQVRRTAPPGGFTFTVSGVQPTTPVRWT